MKAAWREYRRMMLSILGDPKSIGQFFALMTLILVLAVVIYGMDALVEWVFS